MTKAMKIPGWPDAFTPQMPGFGASKGGSDAANPFTEGLDFVRSLWAGAPGVTPGFAIPTFDIGEIDKRIQDLRAALTWLEMNVNMLKATIQGMEVQRNTLAALTAMGGSMGGIGNNAAEFFKNAAAAAQVSPQAPPPSAARQAPAYGSIPPDWPNNAAQSAPPESDDARWGKPAPADESPVEEAALPDADSRTPSKADAAPMAAQPIATPWLDFMQDQFNKIAAAAVTTPVAPVAPVAQAAPAAAPGVAKAGIKSTRSAPTARSSRSTAKPPPEVVAARKKSTGKGA